MLNPNKIISSLSLLYSHTHKKVGHIYDRMRQQENLMCSDKRVSLRYSGVAYSLDEQASETNQFTFKC